MRKSFKKHVIEFCNLHHYDFSETSVDDRWFLRIDRYIKIFSSFNSKNEYVLLDNVLDIRIVCKASAWDIMTEAIDKLMKYHEDVRAGRKATIPVF